MTKLICSGCQKVFYRKAKNPDRIHLCFTCFKNYLGRETAAHPEVRRHWQSIADGKIPFGYVLSDQ